MSALDWAEITLVTFIHVILVHCISEQQAITEARPVSVQSGQCDIATLYTLDLGGRGGGGGLYGILQPVYGTSLFLINAP